MNRKPDLSKLDKEELIRLMELPNHLRETMLAVIALDREVTATDVSRRTGKARATESNVLNQLVRLTYLEKRKKGRTAYFSPKH